MSVRHLAVESAHLHEKISMCNIQTRVLTIPLHITQSFDDERLFVKPAFVILRGHGIGLCGLVACLGCPKQETVPGDGITGNSLVACLIHCKWSNLCVVLFMRVRAVSWRPETLGELSDQ